MINNTNTKELVRGQIYKVVESCGMLILEGKYLGKLNKGYNFECFVFERVNPDYEIYSKFFGAQWQIINNSHEKPDIYLYNTHYGDTPSKLKKVNDQYEKEAKLDFDTNE